MMSNPSSIHPSEAASRLRLAAGVPSPSHANTPDEEVARTSSGFVAVTDISFTTASSSADGAPAARSGLFLVTRRFYAPLPQI